MPDAFRVIAAATTHLRLTHVAAGALRWLVLAVAAVAGVVWAFPVADVAARCPTAAEAGHGWCVMQKGWGSAVMQALAVVLAAHTARVVLLAGGRRARGRLMRTVTSGATLAVSAPADGCCAQCGQALPRAAAAPRAAPADVAERRTAPRHRVALAAELERDDGARVPVVVVDASLTGLLLRDAGPLAIGDRVRLHVDAPGGAGVALAVEVVRETRTGDVGVTVLDRGSARARLAAMLSAPVPA